jgi:hypothetical protein
VGVHHTTCASKVVTRAFANARFGDRSCSRLSHSLPPSSPSDFILDYFVLPGHGVGSFSSFGTFLTLSRSGNSRVKRSCNIRLMLRRLQGHLVLLRICVLPDFCKERKDSPFIYSIRNLIENLCQCIIIQLILEALEEEKKAKTSNGQGDESHAGSMTN